MQLVNYPIYHHKCGKGIKTKMNIIIPYDIAEKIIIECPKCNVKYLINENK